jgi:ABC-type ATPase involved in cell division
VGELSVINNVLAGRLGEQQRVALARILIQNPEVILADEPVASLDPQRAEDILKLLVNLAFGILVDLRFYKVFSMGIFRSLLS